MKPTVFGPICIDTREQSPWSFPGLETVRCALAAGDYAPSPDLADVCAIERKSLDDFTSTLTHGRERFEGEMRKLGTFKRALIVVEASVEMIQRGEYRSHATPASLIGSVASIHARWGVPTMFFRDRRYAEQFAAKWLEKCAKHLQEKIG